MEGTLRSETSQLSPGVNAVISILFWISLIVAASLYAVLALSPRLSESLKLRDQYISNAIKLSTLNQELKHLALVVDALEHDPEFVTRVASRELVAVPAGGDQFRVETSLNYDARVPHVVTPQAPPPPWYAGRVHEIAEPSAFRSRWSFATLTLFSLAFICLNQGFFSNRLGTSFLRLCENLKRRYQAE